MLDLKDDSELRQACQSLLSDQSTRAERQQWVENLGRHLVSVRDAPREMFCSTDFQKKLWDSENVSATGSGNIRVDKLIHDQEMADLLWRLKSTALSPIASERADQIAKFWTDANNRIKDLGLERTPRLKLYRVFAAIHPEAFTTVAHQRKMKDVARALGVGSSKEFSDQPTALHQRIVDRISEVLGTAPPPLEQEFLEQMTLPWLLFSKHLNQQQGEEPTEVVEGLSGEEVLKPLPADRRRRQLIPIRDYVAGIRGMIEFVSEGCKREDFKDHIKTVSPELSDKSISTAINALMGDWGVIRSEGDSVRLTPRGRGLLDTGDTEEVSDWLLTRILGFDNVLFTLKQGPRTRAELIAELQKVNPGWGSVFVPGAMLNWLPYLGLTGTDESGKVSLTAQGQAWAERIHWTPEKLASTKADAVSAASSHRPREGFSRPSVTEIAATFPQHLRFDLTVLQRLDAGLWSRGARHFAVLAGLSGSGKTQLALHYGKALWGANGPSEAGLLTLPVQPGWHDPSSLLGYINPLDSESYVKTAFLDFLLRASADPERPYTMLLDEMNLSHPEQYLAPILSAMETGGDIELHAQGSDINGVPPRLPYPANLVLIGTVNMDETTHGLSDKVLDRAFVIEFWEIDVGAYPGWSSTNLKSSDIEVIRQTLLNLSKALRPVRLHFGWRTIGDVLGYVQVATAGGMKLATALDHAVYAKVLPKLRGEDSPRLQKSLQEVQAVLIAENLSESAAKLDELREDLQALGSARFWR